MIQIPGNISVSSTVNYKSSQESVRIKRQETQDTKTPETESTLDIKKFSYQSQIKAEFDLNSQAGVFTASDNQSSLQENNQQSDPGAIPDEASLITIPISELTPEQAGELIGDDGYYGIAQTSQRILDFVLAGAGDDLERLRAGREGVLRGLREAQEAWGGTLPDISQATIDRTIEGIDEKIGELGGSVIEVTT